MAATIHQLRKCLAGLSRNDRNVLQLRFGIGGKPSLTDAQVAARTGETEARVAAQELAAVRRLVAFHRHGGCSTASATTGGGATVAAPTAVAKPAASSPPVQHHSGGGISIGEALAGVLVLASLLAVGRELRRVLFPHAPR